MENPPNRKLTDLFSLEGRVAVVTGAARGIGLAIAERLAEAGAQVVVADRDASGAEQAAGRLSQLHGRACIGLGMDVCNKNEVDNAASTALSRLGRLDIWVNNAGIYPMHDPVAVSTVEFEKVFHVNVTGVQHGMAAAIGAMTQAQRPGVVINIASTAAFRGSGAYSASKWAVRGLTQGIAPVVGPQGIRVVALAPSITRTPGMEELKQHAQHGDLVARVVQRIPLGRAGEPDDVACAAVFLASDAASFITGVTLVVDGGSMTAM